MDCFAPPPFLKFLKKEDEAISQCPRADSRVGRSSHFTGSVGCCCCQVLFEPGLLLCCQVQQRVKVKRNEVDQPQVNAVPLARTCYCSDPTSAGRIKKEEKKEEEKKEKKERKTRHHQC